MYLVAKVRSEGCFLREERQAPSWIYPVPSSKLTNASLPSWQVTWRGGEWGQQKRCCWNPSLAEQEDWEPSITPECSQFLSCSLTDLIRPLVVRQGYGWALWRRRSAPYEAIFSHLQEAIPPDNKLDSFGIPVGNLNLAMTQNTTFLKLTVRFCN